VTITPATVEELGAWCLRTPQLAGLRKQAWDEFFGVNDPRPVDYMPGTEGTKTRERRFLGYFMFTFRLPSGESPAERAAFALYDGPALAETVIAVRAAVYVFASVRSVFGRSIFLDAGGREYEVRSSTWAKDLAKAGVMAAHLVPARHQYWVHGPGWVSLPIRLGPGAVVSVTSAEADPMHTERFLQRRDPEDERPSTELPNDRSLAAAIRRMDAWANIHNEPRLIASPRVWSARVRKHLHDYAAMAFFQEVMDLADRVTSVEEANELTALASNIWNNTPQPDRGGQSARKLARAQPPKLENMRLDSAEMEVRGPHSRSL
jgi:hypothetical protein